MNVKWGKGGIPIRTTSENLSDHEEGLIIKSLPRTFRDAVRIGKLLGYKYLWIGSLCIVQDTAEDWEREAAKMASIFRCADIVLCAASASNSTEGGGIGDYLEPAFSFVFPSVPGSEYDTPAQTDDVPRTRLLNYPQRYWRLYTPRVMSGSEARMHISGDSPCTAGALLCSRPYDLAMSPLAPVRRWPLLQGANIRLCQNRK
jgi:hypothetical protein